MRDPRVAADRAPGEASAPSEPLPANALLEQFPRPIAVLDREGKALFLNGPAREAWPRLAREGIETVLEGAAGVAEALREVSAGALPRWRELARAEATGDRLFVSRVEHASARLVVWAEPGEAPRSGKTRQEVRLSAHPAPARSRLDPAEAARALREAIAAIEAFTEPREALEDVAEALSERARELRYLAVNAAIEAARAGEPARGLGVVAEEIRVLADEIRRGADEAGFILRESASHLDSLARSLAHATDALVSETGLSTVRLPKVPGRESGGGDPDDARARPPRPPRRSSGRDPIREVLEGE